MRFIALVENNLKIWNPFYGFKKRKTHQWCWICEKRLNFMFWCSKLHNIHLMNIIFSIFFVHAIFVMKQLQLVV